MKINEGELMDEVRSLINKKTLKAGLDEKLAADLAIDVLNGLIAEYQMILEIE